MNPQMRKPFDYIALELFETLLEVSPSALFDEMRLVADLSVSLFEREVPKQSLPARESRQGHRACFSSAEVI